MVCDIIERMSFNKSGIRTAGGKDVFSAIEKKENGMNIHYLQHVPFESLGMIETWALKKEHTVSSSRLYLDETLPKPESVDILVVMGGPMNIYEDKKYPWLVREKQFIEKVISLKKTVLGICLGAQLVSDILGGKVYPSGIKEIGWFPVEKTFQAENLSILNHIPDKTVVFHWHGDTFDLPDNAVHIFQNDACRHQGFIYDGRVVGLQFHMEVTRSGILNLIENCRDELVIGPYIQTPEEMLSTEDRLENMHRMMCAFLDAFMTVS